MDSVIEKLNQNLQVIYRKALDADQALDQLQAQGKAKHKVIFAEDAGFTVRSNRFQPYLEELAGNIAMLPAQSEEQVEHSLAIVVKQMESLFVTLANLKNTLSE